MFFLLLKKEMTQFCLDRLQRKWLYFVVALCFNLVMFLKNILKELTNSGAWLNLNIAPLILSGKSVILYKRCLFTKKIMVFLLNSIAGPIIPPLIYGAIIFPLKLIFLTTRCDYMKKAKISLNLFAKLAKSIQVKTTMLLLHVYVKSIRTSINGIGSWHIPANWC